VIHDNVLYNSSATDFPEPREGSTRFAFVLGMAIIGASILIGRTYAFFLSFLALSLLMTLIWRKNPRPWIFLVSVSAATPLAISKQQFACNVVFAIWFAAVNTRYLFKLPRWSIVLIAMAVFGVFTSSINWMSSNIVGSILRQGAYASNFLLAPFVLLPAVYVRMKESRDHAANLQGLLFCLILPSTMILISAKLFGTVWNDWEASQHSQSLAEGFLMYKLGQVVVNFLRTEVGFILAALICASAAVTVSQVKTSYRLLAGACLASNAFLLLSTASFGSGLASLCGLAVIFFIQFRTVSVTKVIVSVVVIFGMLMATYVFAPSSTKKYLEQRYTHRVTNADTDRLTLWARAVDQLFQHPEGVGMTMSVGDRKKTFIHNDYLTYAVSYGFIGGLAYTALVLGLLISFLLRRKRKDEDPSALAVYLAGLGVIVALAVNGITDHSNENRWYFNAIWSMIWYCYFCSRAAQKKAVQEGMTSETVIAGTAASHDKSVPAYT